MSDTTIATRNSAPTPDLMEKVLVGGDLERLTAAERLQLYRAVCESIGLNPLSRPFEYIRLQNKLTLYARKDATDQLRRIHGISLTILSRDLIDDLYVVAVRATAADGRSDEDVGAVAIGNLHGDAKANGIMKAITKAKRRATLSVCGLGWLDETETETVRDAVPVRVDHTTGEIVVDDADYSPPIGKRTTRSAGYMDEPAAEAPEPIGFIFVDAAPGSAAADAPVDPDAPSTTKQHQDIFRLVSGQLGYNANHVVDLLQQRYGVRNRKDLTYGQAEDLLAYLNTQLPKA